MCVPWASMAGQLPGDGPLCSGTGNGPACCVTQIPNACGSAGECCGNEGTVCDACGQCSLTQCLCFC